MNNADMSKAQSKALLTREARKACPFNEGDTVNYGFNGDYYTATVVKVSDSGHQVHVQEKDGKEIKLFTRRANGAYRSAGHGTWRLAPGARDERNPSF